MSQRSIAVSTTRRPYDSTPFRSHARSKPVAPRRTDFRIQAAHQARRLRVHRPRKAQDPRHIPRGPIHPEPVQTIDERQLQRLPPRQRFARQHLDQPHRGQTPAARDHVARRRQRRIALLTGPQKRRQRLRVAPAVTAAL